MGDPARRRRPADRRRPRRAGPSRRCRRVRRRRATRRLRAPAGLGPWAPPIPPGARPRRLVAARRRGPAPIRRRAGARTDVVADALERRGPGPVPQLAADDAASALALHLLLDRTGPAGRGSASGWRRAGRPRPPSDPGRAHHGGARRGPGPGRRRRRPPCARSPTAPTALPAVRRRVGRRLLDRSWAGRARRRASRGARFAGGAAAQADDRAPALRPERGVARTGRRGQVVAARSPADRVPAPVRSAYLGLYPAAAIGPRRRPEGLGLRATAGVAVAARGAGPRRSLARSPGRLRSTPARCSTAGPRPEPPP